MKIRGWFSGGRLLALLSVANLLLGVGLFAVRSPERVAIVAATPALPAQIAALEALMDGNHHGQPFTLTLTDAELANTVAYFIAESNGAIPFSDVSVTIGNDQLVVNGKARGGAFVVPVRATLTASVANGVPVFAIEDVGLGRTPLPTFVRDQVIQQANAALDLSAYDLGVTLQSLTLGDHLVTIVGTIN